MRDILRSDTAKVTAYAVLLATATMFSVSAFGIDPGTRAKIAVIGARAAGNSSNFATVACHAPPADVAGFTERARGKFAADAAFETDFAAGQIEGAQLARKWMGLAASDSDAQANLADQCVTSLQNMKTR